MVCLRLLSYSFYYYFPGQLASFPTSYFSFSAGGSLSFPAVIIFGYGWRLILFSPFFVVSAMKKRLEREALEQDHDD